MDSGVQGLAGGPVTAREVLDIINTRLQAASIHDGPWAVEEDDTWGAKVYVREPGFGTMYICENLNQGEDWLSDAEFIAAAPVDVARLTRAVEAVLEIADYWERTPALRKGTAASEVRAAIENALGEAS